MGRFSNGTEQSIEDNQSMNGVTDRESCEDIRSGAFAETHHFLHSEQAANTPPLITQRQRHNQAKLGLGQAQAPPPKRRRSPLKLGRESTTFGQLVRRKIIIKLLPPDVRY